MANLIGQEGWSSLEQTTQVYKATHDGAGNSLPYMQKSFISFTFGGKAIEDFGLIAIIDEDRLKRKAYADFSDVTSTYDVLDGQIYWGSNFSPNQLDLSLATDEITEQQIDNFKEWFSPGKERELILSEHPNRAILARVASTPKFNFLPFEKNTSIMVNGFSYETSTTIYKGEVQLSFIMDEPHWYGKLSYMPIFLDKKTLEILEASSENSNKIQPLNDKDFLKVMLEDNIPYQDTLNGTLFLGNNLLITSESRTNSARVGQSYLGTITTESEGLTIGEENPKYLFYSGTAPSYPTIQFTLYPNFDFSSDEKIDIVTWTKRYIKTPKNSFVSDDYSYIKIGEKYFYFTTPSLLTSFNKALYYLKQIPFNTSTSDIINDLTEQIPNYYARAWAIACVKSLEGYLIINQNEKIITSQTQRIALVNNMFSLFTNENLTYLPKTNVNYHFDGNHYIFSDVINIFNSKLHTSPMIFNFNSKTGEATMKASVRVAIDNDIENSVILDIEQNVGDMACSNYITIEGRNYLNSKGKLTIDNCKEITSDLNLSNVLVFYQNMYL